VKRTDRSSRPKQPWHPTCAKCGEPMPEVTPHPQYTHIEVAAFGCGFQIFFRVTTRPQ
jgi:hypothetical protein